MPERSRRDSNGRCRLPELRRRAERLEGRDDDDNDDDDDVDDDGLDW